MGVLNVGPSVPTESSPGVPAGGFSQWFRNIADWIKSMSPSWSTDYDTGWVDVPLGPGFQAIGVGPKVRRVGREVKWAGQVQPNPAGVFPINAVTFITSTAGVPSGFRPTEIVNRATSSGSASQVARAYVRTDGQVAVVTGSSTGGYYDLSSLSGYMVD